MCMRLTFRRAECWSPSLRLCPIRALAAPAAARHRALPPTIRRWRVRPCSLSPRRLQPAARLPRRLLSARLFLDCMLRPPT